MIMDAAPQIGRHAIPRRAQVAHLAGIFARLQRLLHTADAAASLCAQRFHAIAGRLEMLHRHTDYLHAHEECSYLVQHETGTINQLRHAFQVDHTTLHHRLQTLTRLTGAIQPNDPLLPAMHHLLATLVPIEERAHDLTGSLHDPLHHSACLLSNLSVRIVLQTQAGQTERTLDPDRLVQASRRLKAISVQLHELADAVQAYQHSIAGSLGSVRRDLVQIGASYTEVDDEAEAHAPPIVGSGAPWTGAPVPGDTADDR